MQREKKYPLVTCSPANKVSLLHQVHGTEPLWKRVPTRDKQGKPYADFMMFIPGLKKFDSNKLSETISKLESVFRHYEKVIVLADLNLKLNVLWVTLHPIQGLTTEVAAFIHHLLPEAKLVSQHRAS